MKTIITVLTSVLITVTISLLIWTVQLQEEQIKELRSQVEILHREVDSNYNAIRYIIEKDNLPNNTINPTVENDSIAGF